MNKTIHVIHPEPSIRSAARFILEPLGYGVQESRDFTPGDFDSPDLLLMYWTTSGYMAKSMHYLRNGDSTRQSRVIVLSARADLGAAITSLELGVDDCVITPFEGAELVARVNSSLRRPPAHSIDAQLRAGPLVLDHQMHQLLVCNQAVGLSPTEFRLIAFMMEHQGRVFSRTELLRSVWSSNVHACSRTVDVHVRRLRQQLEPFGCESIIQTVRGFGYRLRPGD